MEINVDLRFYAIRNRDGQWLRAKGYGGGGKSWVDDIIDAKVYLKKRAARTQITWWSSHHPGYGIPELIELVCTKGVILEDENKRVEKSIQKKKEEKVRMEINRKKWDIERAERELKEAQERYNNLRK